MNIMQPIRLSQLSHGGGCGCKLAPSVLQELLSGHPVTTRYKQLLVGVETGDDAGVWELDNGTCVIATTDFFMPMVDDPHDFGRIAATNALSDIYAMGGAPIMALAILGMPVDKIPAEMVRKILEGGASICEVAGIPVAGGASMGALRAAECSAFGMIGIGEVYRRYANGEVTDDADVAQLHAPEELNYLPLTEPWVNVEPTLRRMQEQEILRAEAVIALIATAQRVHYRERTYPEVVRQTEGLTEEEGTAALQWLRENAIDQKRLDALAVLEWLRGQPGAREVRALPWQLQETTQWMELLRTMEEGA